MKNEKIALLGGGNMGRALVGGMIKQGARRESITVGEAFETARRAIEKEFGVTALPDNAAAVEDASLVVIAVKPQDVGAVLAPLAGVLQKNRALVLSVAAGIRTASLERWCGESVLVVRAMPNRPALVGAGATALFAGDGVQGSERKRAENVMSAAGDVVWVDDEDLLDVVTALSGSGPAYFFLLAEAMMKAATKLGLKEDAARRLAIGTLHGAGLMAQQSDGDLARLRAEVTSKGGTTEAALHAFEADGFERVVARALAAATKRSRELAEQFGGTEAFR
jgi:pyrroline-5-carboxylate reductase